MYNYSIIMLSPYLQEHFVQIFIECILYEDDEWAITHLRDSCNIGKAEEVREHFKRTEYTLNLLVKDFQKYCPEFVKEINDSNRDIKDMIRNAVARFALFARPAFSNPAWDIILNSNLVDHGSEWKSMLIAKLQR